MTLKELLKIFDEEIESNKNILDYEIVIEEHIKPPVCDVRVNDCSQTICLVNK